MRSAVWIVPLLGLMAADALAAPQTLVSPETRVSLMELYTSEGCSSCPPAEKWISTLQGDARLWKQVVPITFHVDYWDYLGWKDPFDSHAYTERQQQIAAHASNLAGRVIYTPQFVLDGQDWRNWFNGKPLQVDDAAKIGPLSLTADGNRVRVHFVPSSPTSGQLEAHVVVLAFGVDVRVGAGENSGATLGHDFLVVGYSHSGMTGSKGGYDTQVILAPTQVKAQRYALAGWVSKAGDTEPLQAVGGWTTGMP